MQKSAAVFGFCHDDDDAGDDNKNKNNLISRFIPWSEGGQKSMYYSRWTMGFFFEGEGEILFSLKRTYKSDRYSEGKGI